MVSQAKLSKVNVQCVSTFGILNNIHDPAEASRVQAGKEAASRARALTLEAAEVCVSLVVFI